MSGLINAPTGQLGELIPNTKPINGQPTFGTPTPRTIPRLDPFFGGSGPYNPFPKGAFGNPNGPTNPGADIGINIGTALLYEALDPILDRAGNSAGKALLVDPKYNSLEEMPVRQRAHYCNTPGTGKFQGQCGPYKIPDAPKDPVDLRKQLDKQSEEDIKKRMPFLPENIPDIGDFFRDEKSGAEIADPNYSPPFEGGQCPGVSYRVSYSAQAGSNSPVNVNRTLPGPIQGPYVEKNETYTESYFMAGVPPQRYTVQSSGPEVELKVTVSGVIPLNGATDNCGSIPPPQVPDRQTPTPPSRIRTPSPVRRNNDDSSDQSNPYNPTGLKLPNFEPFKTPEIDLPNTQPSIEPKPELEPGQEPLKEGAVPNLPTLPISPTLPRPFMPLDTPKIPIIPGTATPPVTPLGNVQLPKIGPFFTAPNNIISNPRVPNLIDSPFGQIDVPRFPPTPPTTQCQETPDDCHCVEPVIEGLGGLTDLLNDLINSLGGFDFEGANLQGAECEDPGVAAPSLEATLEHMSIQLRKIKDDTCDLMIRVPPEGTGSSEFAGAELQNASCEEETLATVETLEKAIEHLSNQIRQVQLNSCAISQRVGVTDFPAEVPVNFADPDAGSKEINSLAELTVWVAEQLDGLLGQFPSKLKVTGPDGDEVEMVLPNVAETLSEMMGLLVDVLINSSETLNTSSRALNQAGSATQQAFLAYTYAKANADYLGYEGRLAGQEMPLSYTPGKEVFDGFLEPSKVNVQAWENTDKEDIKNHLATLLQSAAIIRAVHWRRLDPKGSFKDQIKDIIGAAAQFMDEDGNLNSEDWEKYLRDVESGFSRFTNDASPYGRTPTEGPRIRDVSPGERDA